MRHYTRRRVLCGSGIAAFGTLAGCSALSESSSDTDDLTLERLDWRCREPEHPAEVYDRALDGDEIFQLATE